MSGINSPAKDAGDFQIEWDEERDEPFCRIDVRGKEYHMTMWRESDADDMVNLWNHPLVGKWSYKRPFPFTHAHLPEAYNLFLYPDRAVIPGYWAYMDSATPETKIPERCILRVLRTPEGKMIGNFGLFNYLVGIDDLSAPELDRGKKKWEISYDLDPNHWGQGLGKGIIGFLVSMGSWMGANVLTARVATANPASQGVLQANGFEKRYTRFVTMPEDKGGSEVEVSEWAKQLSSKSV